MRVSGSSPSFLITYKRLELSGLTDAEREFATGWRGSIPPLRGILYQSRFSKRRIGEPMRNTTHPLSGGFTLSRKWPCNERGTHDDCS